MSIAIPHAVLGKDPGGVSTGRSVEKEIPPMPFFNLSDLSMKSKEICS